MLGKKVLTGYPTLYFPKVEDVIKFLPCMKEIIEKEKQKYKNDGIDSLVVVFNEKSNDYSLVLLAGRSVVNCSTYPAEEHFCNMFNKLTIQQHFLRRRKQINNMNGNLWIQC